VWIASPAARNDGGQKDYHAGKSARNNKAKMTCCKFKFSQQRIENMGLKFKEILCNFCYTLNLF